MPISKSVLALLAKKPKENFSEYILALIKRNRLSSTVLEPGASVFLDHKARFELESTEPWMNVKVS